jgi:hypothetical protein
MQLIPIYRSTIIEYLRLRYFDSASGLVYFYCKDRSLKQQILKTFMMVFVTQLTKIQPDCLGEIEAARCRNDRSLTELEYINLMKAILIKFRRLVVVVDALDESVEASKFSETFAEILRFDRNNTNVFILVTSREDVNSERLLGPLAVSRLSLTDRTKADIRTYVSAEVDWRIRSRTLKLRDHALQTEIVDSLVARADGL